MGEKRGRYKWWCLGNSKGNGSVRVLVKEESFEKVVEVRRWSDRVMTGSISILILGAHVFVGMPRKMEEKSLRKSRFFF